MAMTLRLDDEQDRRLQAFADDAGISKHEVIVRAIDTFVSGREQRRQQLLSHIVAQDAALLDLLSR